MAYQRERTAEDYDWIECYVCGERETNGLTDLAGPITTYDQACTCCKEQGAPKYKPKDWTRVQSLEVLAKRKAAEPPPPVPTPISPEEAARRKEWIKEHFARLLM